MKPRIAHLRRQSLEAVNRISAERALLITQFYQYHVDVSDPVPVQRAKAFEFLLSRKKISILENELIVGERGPAPKATPTYPEITIHSMEDLEVLHHRKKVSFYVDDETRKAYKEVIIPFWKGRSNRDRIMESMSPEWLDAYQAGIFTEFMEQRAPGHTVAGSMIFRKGMTDLLEEIEEAWAKTEFVEEPLKQQMRHELSAMRIAANAIVMYARRHADELERLAEKEKEGIRKQELQDMAAICRRVPANAPATFHEALQHYWFMHLGVITELNPWDSFNPGRLDQHLWPFYQRDINEGRLDRERAKELLEAFWIKFNNHPAPPKVGVTAEESNTYTDFTLINLGGVKPDGTDAVNELSFLLLDVIEEMRLLQPGTMIQLSRVNPDAFIERALKIIKTGFGQPSIFNADAIEKELTAQGKNIVDARNGGASGCVESGAFGTESYILTGYFNLPKILEITLHNGFDPRTQKQIGLKTGEPGTFKGYDDLLSAFKKQVQYFAQIKIRGSNTIEKIFMDHLPTPFLSLIIEDCIAKGTDYIRGGARYNTNYIQGVGLGTITDSLASWRVNIFEKKRMSPYDFLQVLQNDFEGYEDSLYHLLYHTPKYGNDDDEADRHAVEVFEIFHDAVTGHTSPRGATYRINMLPTTCHVYFGSVMHASADGRRAGKPLSEGISPVQGADVKGPTAVMKSAAKIDHLRTGGTLLNQKFSPSFFSDEESIKKVAALVRGYFRLNGHHVQFNVVDADTLLDAQRHPEKYRDLIVRVAGYSDYFNDLGTELQDEIIRRTAHESV
ncbi:trans-4-hydroxy-L-proline dehydratase [Thermophagus xiamenensis]|uniref:Formate C-acetyltransferase n=1 Tax=Thermophagus xiamenensis TaxID=385682 RepID=A0A1I2FCZ4_9BACT|nr:trans-4-hydroxy-L-proline dehydratase [Thermophagus xiamenensis]SFF02893.1 formate C-acetyltransferase [Thermophagus xiamenensis]